MMMQRSSLLLSRLFSSAANSPLAKLRKKTGFPIGKCKEALTKHNNDLEASEQWLISQAQKEGWAKVEKLQGRTAQQGLIGIISRPQLAAMVEVNCETDFVARNATFQELATTVITAVHDNTRSTHHNSTEHLTPDSIGNLPSGERILSDLVAESVGHLGENILLHRGCTMSASSGQIFGYAYNNIRPASSELALGTYGALVHLVSSSDSSSDLGPGEEVSTLGRKLCQHVIAMDPAVVEGESEAEVEDSSRVLVSQEYLFDSELSVGEVLEKGGVKVVSFVRYALGEATV